MELTKRMIGYDWIIDGSEGDGRFVADPGDSMVIQIEPGRSGRRCSIKTENFSAKVAATLSRCESWLYESIDFDGQREVLRGLITINKDWGSDQYLAFMVYPDVHDHHEAHAEDEFAGYVFDKGMDEWSSEKILEHIRDHDLAATSGPSVETHGGRYHSGGGG